MRDIAVKRVTESEKDYGFEVSVDGREISVSVSREYYQKLTAGKISADELVRKSIEFLLEREPASSILSEFDLPLIGHYFPEYEVVIQKEFKK